MKRTAGAMMLLAALSGWGTPGARAGNYMSHAWDTNSNTDPYNGIHWGVHTAPAVPAAQGPWGQPVPMVAPYSSDPPSGEAAAKAMLNQSMPLELLQQANLAQGGMPGPGVMPVSCPPGGCPPGGCGPGGCQPGGGISPPGVPALPGMPGYSPPGGGPGFGPPGAVAAVGAITPGSAPGPFAAQRTEIRFVGPAGMKIAWCTPGVSGKGGAPSQYLEAPARYNFLQGAIYRLKLYDIPNRPGVELYPTLEVVPAKAATCTFLAHSAVPITFTEDDFEQVAAGNLVVKVIYLPNPQFQDLATTGPDEVVSSRLEPGVDPIAEACRRGSILAVVRLGNIDLEAPNTPAMDAPSPFCPPGQGGAPGSCPPMPTAAAGPGPMVPYGAMGPRPAMARLPGAATTVLPGPMTAPAMPPPPPSGPPTQIPSGPSMMPGLPVGQLPPASMLESVQYSPSGSGKTGGQGWPQVRSGSSKP